MRGVMINMISLTLLAISLAACSSTTTKTAGIRVVPPNESNKQLVLIRIAKDGTLQIDGQACDIDELGQKASDLNTSAGAASDAFEGPQFNIASEQGADNASLVAVMSKLSSVGIRNINIVSDY